MNWKIWIFFLMICIAAMGCTSREARLNQEYEQISNEIDGLQSELKATVNAQNAAEDYARAHETYNKKLERLMEVRKFNAEKGLPLGPDIDTGAQPKDLAKNLRTNFDTLSDKVSELKKKKGKIVEEQMNIPKE